MVRRSIFFVFIALLVVLPQTGISQTFDLGEINSAKYKIYIPENWKIRSLHLRIITTTTDTMSPWIM